MPLNERNPELDTCRILIVENQDDLRAGLSRELRKFGHEVTVETERCEAIARDDLMKFDLLVSDLVSGSAPEVGGIVRSFKLAVTSDSTRRTIPSLHEIIERTLAYKQCCIDPANDLAHLREKIDLELPSDLTLMNSVLEYLLARVERLGMVEVEQSNLYVALDEAFVNAVKHGNRNNAEKLLRVTGELSAREAIFTVEDEGDGFDVREIPDPTDPANLFKSSGRGVLLIYNIMDEVEYSQGGAKLRMVKRPQNGARTS